MNRNDMLQRLDDAQRIWDLIVIGGGATGLGCAIDAATRGYDVLLLERGDLAAGTSSRSTKLAHGGVRYLQQGNVSLVLEALRERGLMRQNAPHLVHDLPFVVPTYDWWDAPFYGVGLRIYDVLAGKLGFGRSRRLTKQATLEMIPTIETEGLRGGVIYYDGQFDDARLAVNMAQTGVEQGATILNYVNVTGLTRNDEGYIDGVTAEDVETGRGYTLRARVVINATGVFADSVRRMDEADVPTMIRPSHGAHIVLDRSFLPGDAAVMVPRTDDGRVLFAIPWYDRVIVGTTDTPMSEIPVEPRPLSRELDFLLEHAARYLSKDPGPGDVRSMFAGLRPLVGSTAPDQKTAAISRDHTVHISQAGLITIAGGKWTTYRKMAEDTIDQAASLAGLDMAPCATRNLRLHGYHEDAAQFGDLAPYGSDAPALRELMQSDARYARKLHPDLPYDAAQVIWAVRHEMARTVADVLARRMRALLLDARLAAACAPAVAALMAEELGFDEQWQAEQVASFNELAKGYLLTDNTGDTV